MLGQRNPVLRLRHDLLHPRLGEMGLQRHPVGDGQRGARTQEGVGTMQRDGWADTWANAPSLHGPRSESLGANSHRALPVRQCNRGDPFAKLSFEGIEKARQRGKYRLVGNHRGDDGPYANRIVRFRDSVNALDAGARQLDKEVKTGGAALSDEFDCGKLCREPKVIRSPLHVEPRCARQESLQRHRVGYAAATQGAV